MEHPKQAIVADLRSTQRVVGCIAKFIMKVRIEVCTSVQRVAIHDHSSRQVLLQHEAVEEGLQIYLNGCARTNLIIDIWPVWRSAHDFTALHVKGGDDFLTDTSCGRCSACQKRYPGWNPCPYLMYTCIRRTEILAPTTEKVNPLPTIRNSV